MPTEYRLAPDAQVEMSMKMTEAGADMVKRFPRPKRLIQITLAPGQSFPPEVKKGRHVEMTMHGHRMAGRVLFKRLNRVSIEAEDR